MRDSKPGSQVIYFQMRIPKNREIVKCKSDEKSLYLQIQFWTILDAESDDFFSENPIKADSV